MKTLLNMSLSEIYLDYMNNFATIGFMSEHYEVEYDFMMSLFESARNLYCTVYDPK